MSKSPFLQLISDTMYERRYAKRTIETYLIWIKGYIYFHQKKRQRISNGNTCFLLGSYQKIPKQPFYAVIISMKQLYKKR